jgi:hypothetical protein
MSSLVEKLQREVQDRDITVSALLREAKVVAARLNLPETPAWIDQELNGYQPHAGGIAYRCVPNRWTSRRIGETVWKPIARGLNDNGVAVDAISYTVPEIESYLSSSSGSETVVIPWFSPRGVVPDHPADFQIEIVRSQLIKILDAVRNRVFDWSLELERQGITGHVLSLPHESPTLEEIEERLVAFIRAAPRGIREITPEHRYNGRKTLEVNDEYDLQDFLRAFLRMEFADLIHEDPLPKVASLSGRIDFALRDQRIYIELKVVESESSWKSTMSKDVASKIERYGRSHECDLLIVFIYDPTHAMRDAARIEKDLTNLRTIDSKSFRTRAVVAPQH